MLLFRLYSLFAVVVDVGGFLMYKAFYRMSDKLVPILGNQTGTQLSDIGTCIQIYRYSSVSPL